MDLEGVSRDRSVREQILQFGEQTTMATNDFGDKTFDINRPPREPYKHQDYPKAVYHADGRVLNVNDAKEEKAALRKGFELKPHPARDYSQTRNGRAPVAAEPVEEVLEDDALAAGDDQLDDVHPDPVE